MLFFNVYNDYFFEFWFSLLFFNVLVYIFLLVNIFLLFFLFDLKYLKTLNELKFMSNLPLIFVFTVLLLLSFAGIPPLLGFLSKFLIFIFLISKKNFFVVFIFLFFNVFVIYFYLQNLRFIVSKNISNKFVIKNNFVNFNKNIIFYINFFNFFNLFGLFYFEEFFIFLNYISSSVFI